uniref:Uncharacterized protein n=1 Tax=Caenorhabditis japonica TaxID=281687 RepID=A0A8R1DR34_CAEJA
MRTLPAILLLTFLTLPVRSDEEQSGEEPPDEVLLIMGENATFLNSNETIYEAEEPWKFNFLETYLPLFIFVLDLSVEDRQVLQNYMTEKTYEKLKYDIDSKVRMNREDSVLTRINESLVESINSLERFDEATVDVVEGYHNASVYNAIRCVYLKQLRPFLPLIDQMAIMQYLAQRKVSEYERMSIWARIWENLNAWMYGKKKANECYAVEPKCVRHALEKLSFEQRVDLDKAAYENRFDSVDDIIRGKLKETEKGDELDDWLLRNRPPAALEAILDERSDVEEQALQRLRDNGVLSSLNHYYKAVIETRTMEEQEEIRQFFDTMNDTFARCFDPLRGQNDDF